MTTPTLDHTPKSRTSVFMSLWGLPAGFWIVNLIYMLDAMAYFGIIILMTPYLPTVLGVKDWGAGLIVSFFTGFVTLFMIGIGGVAEKLGVRLGLISAILLCVMGRFLYSGMPLFASGAVLGTCIALGLLLIALGEGIVQPVCYAGIKYYTDEKSSTVAYGMLYGVMNLGIFLIGLISPKIRVPIERIHEARAAGAPEPQSWLAFLADHVTSGYMGVNLVCTAITALALLVLLGLFTRRTESKMIRPPSGTSSPSANVEASQARWLERVRAYFAEGPFKNGRFVFFIFMLLPVQTLFAHQNVTMPNYVLRAYPQNVQDRMEWVLNWINPGIIFIGAPIFAAFTRRMNVYTLMIVGSTVSALPTFLLCAGPSLPLLITYLVVFSVGEVIWQPRFLEYAAELAPPSKVAQYMGLANVPWVTAKMTTGLYSGYFMGRYCPESGPQDTATLWLIYGLIAVLSPIGLLIGRRWVMSGWEGHKAKAAETPAVTEG